MNWKEVHNIYFLGIGGIGMSALARYFHLSGKSVSGYDRTASPLTKELENEGISIQYEDDLSFLPESIKANKDNTLVILTPAIPASNGILQWMKNESYAIHKRSEVLGWITHEMPTIAVAGTHGKTTTTSLIAHLLHASGHGCNAFLGGITANYRTNFLFDTPESWTVVEADEFDRSFHTLLPNIAVITSVDADHLDIYGDAYAMTEAFNEFAEQLESNGSLYVHEKASASIQKKHITYGFGSDAQLKSSPVYFEQSKARFDVTFPNGESWKGLPLPMPGEHNQMNALVAVGIARERGLEQTSIATALNSFKGIKRRFEYQLREGDTIFIDDYAHHPTELSATIDAVKVFHPSKKVTGIFQPHLFSRTKDHIDGFARALEMLDEIILLDIYPAREEPIPGVDSQWLLDKIQHPHKKKVDKSHLLEDLKNRELEVLITLGAGDIDRLVEPIRNLLLSRETA